MWGAQRIGGLAVGAATLFIPLAIGIDSQAQTPAQIPAMPLLTDTPQYCVELSNEVEEDRQALVSPAPPEVEQLAEEGRRLCALGEVRGGIARLRRAVVLLHEISGRS
ncbi:MAG TPA: hypothetical protein VMF62_02690 [Acetobacteraceae bacterium]|jgi:hypothetical protein|nr:hypothetical protein [Acetobacteraceae bacterium]